MSSCVQIKLTLLSACLCDSKSAKTFLPELGGSLEATDRWPAICHWPFVHNLPYPGGEVSWLVFLHSSEAVGLCCYPCTHRFGVIDWHGRCSPSITRSMICKQRAPFSQSFWMSCDPPLIPDVPSVWGRSTQTLDWAQQTNYSLCVPLTSIQRERSRVGDFLEGIPHLRTSQWGYQVLPIWRPVPGKRQSF